MAANIPGYKIVKILGKGGMATVYLALQDIFEREVALKVMAKGLTEDPAFGQRFMREAQIVSKLIHPNIVTVYDVGLHEGSYYLSMEYINGADLKHARQELDFLEKIQAVKSIASALDVSGAKGYVHRDIKPENIMIESGTKRAVLMDFGIARASEADISVTQAGTAIGTPHYMSPEQAKGNDVDPRADLYSLGVVLFYLIAGYVPFEGDSAVAIGIRHITEAVPELPSHLKDLQWFVDKAMAKDPDDRFQTGAEFITALNSLDLEHLANQTELFASTSHTTDFDTPTVVSELPIHQYGDSSRKKEEPESFTLSFTTEEPPTLNIKWPLYAASACVAVIAIVGIYLVASYEPTPITTQAKPAAPQTSIADLVLGRGPKLTPEQQNTLNKLTAEIDLSHKRYQQNAREKELRLLVGLYRQLLAITPNNETAQETLNLLADEQIAKLLPMFNSGDFKEAQKDLAVVLQLFPNYEPQALKLARTRMTMRSKLEDLLDNGDHWYRREQYTQPENENAAQSYQAALEIVPELIPAKEGLERIARTLTAQAHKSLNRAELSDARAAIHQALVALPTYTPALELEAQLLSSSSIEDKIETLLDQADRHTRKGRLFAPNSNNAFDAYTAILAIDKHNTLALQRRDELINMLNERVLKLINEGEYEAAEQRMAVALNQQPNNPDLRQLSKNIDETIAKHKFRHTPRIDVVRASGAANIPLDAQQPRTIAISDKIFFKFTYYNLEDSKIMLSAQLFNHNNNNALGSKPVFVKGPNGESEFIFDLDRNGIKAGTYRLELNLAGKKIAELIFRVG